MRVGVIDTVGPFLSYINMYIPSIAVAAKALAGLDQPRRDFASHFADRISLLPPEALHDEKRIRSELLFELQSRFTPEEAARISYTSSDVLVSIALSIVSERHKAARDARQASMVWRVALGIILTAILLAICAYFLKSPEPAEPPAAPASSATPR